ncbi:MAG: DUF3352 domain-containing protein, partial [Nocardioides sp.]
RPRRTALVAGGAVAGLLAVGGGVWAAMSFFASGPQPAEVLPASTVGYLSVDLDPSGGQKIEAFRMIEKFPAIKKELDGFDADDDLMAKIFGEIEKECDGLSYQDDVQPWLGDRYAVAGVDVGEDSPIPVGVLQVTDAAAADAGLKAMLACGGEEAEAGWVVEGEWVVIAETEELAQQVVDETAEGTLADDATYREWMDEVGEPGVMSMYASPEAGGLLAEAMAASVAADAELGPEVPEETIDEVAKVFEDFGGGAGTVRFADAGLEVVYAADLPTGGLVAMPMAEGRTLDVVNDLPADTAFAYGLALPDGWVDTFIEGLSLYGLPEADVEQGIAQLEGETGLQLPEDLETLLGEQIALSFSGDADLEKMANSSDTSEVPFGVSVEGDPDAIRSVLDKLTTAFGYPEMLETQSDGDRIYWSLSDDYRDALIEGGTLGESDSYRAVVPEADRAAAVMYVDFDAGSWLDSLAEGDQEVADNVEPLSSFGVSSWLEDGTTFGEIRLTTD